MRKQSAPTRICKAGFAFASFIALSTCIGLADETIAVIPSDLKLNGPAASHRLLVERVEEGKYTGQIVDGIVFESSDPGVARVENGVVLPTGNGATTIAVRVGRIEKSLSVEVTDYDEPMQWSFRNHVQSVLSKVGCNSGACHGAAAGKNGFKLSLRGYDPESDYLAITRQSRGRRIVPKDPGRSLFLTKPSGAIPHKGGLRFRVDSLEYRVLSEWLANGHPAPSDDDSRLDRLEVLPANTVLQPGDNQQLLVLAHFDDGRVEDVTRWVKFTAVNVSVADVDQSGAVNVTGPGETAIVAWYLSNNETATITVPYDVDVSPERFAEAPRNNFIDDHVLAKLESLNIPPSPDATDAEFLRRAFLDTIGVLPKASEVRAFLEDESPDKRERLIDELLGRPEFVDYWTHKWCDLFLVTSRRFRPKALQAFYVWIRRHVMNNTAWDRFAREMVTAKGSTYENGATNFYTLHQDPLDMAETVSMAYLGMSIQCARCHDHPLEKWTNDDYYGMASIFARVRGKGWAGDYKQGDGLRTIFTVDDGELIQPRTGRPQLPRPLDGVAIDPADLTDRRIHLADWLTSPENPYFARAISNRVWANFMGTGIVEKIDDLRSTNPPSNEPLLTALAEYLIENEYDLHALMRVILMSKTYQRSSRSLPDNESDERFYSRWYPRRLKAEVLLDAFSRATLVATPFHEQPKGARAMQLIDPGRVEIVPRSGVVKKDPNDETVGSYFLRTFGNPERIITCECERSNEPSMVQVLHLANGDTINRKLEAENNIIGRLMTRGYTHEQIVEELYLNAFSRFPTESETKQIVEIVKEAPLEDERLAWEDLHWSMLTSREFLFNH